MWSVSTRGAFINCCSITFRRRPPPRPPPRLEAWRPVPHYLLSFKHLVVVSQEAFDLQPLKRHFRCLTLRQDEAQLINGIYCGFLV